MLRRRQLLQLPLLMVERFPSPHGIGVHFFDALLPDIDLHVSGRLSFLQLGLQFRIFSSQSLHLHPKRGAFGLQARHLLVEDRIDDLAVLRGQGISEHIGRVVHRLARHRQ